MQLWQTLRPNVFHELVQSDKTRFRLQFGKHARTHGNTDGQVENVMPLAHADSAKIKVTAWSTGVPAAHQTTNLSLRPTGCRRGLSSMSRRAHDDDGATVSVMCVLSFLTMIPGNEIIADIEWRHGPRLSSLVQMSPTSMVRGQFALRLWSVEETIRTRAAEGVVAAGVPYGRNEGRRASERS